jgi:Rrf2 family protein
MMQISTKTEYGLRCLLRLAREPEGEALSLTEICRSEHVPKDYAQQIFLKLRRGGIVRSIRGTEGGFALAQRASAITLAQITRVLEGAPFQDVCDHFNKKTDCGHLDDCSIRPIWQIIGRRLWQALDHITLAQLIDDEKTVGQKMEVELPVLRFQV